MSIEELIAYLTGTHPPGSHAAGMTLADHGGRAPLSGSPQIRQARLKAMVLKAIFGDSDD